MSFAINGLIAAMEEADNEPVAVDADEQLELVETVADDSAAVQADADDVGVTVAQVEDAVQAGEELQDVADVVSEAVESGEGLDESAAEVASIAIESIRNRIGIRGESRLVPATESFGNTNTRMVSTKLIIEGIGDTLKRIWAAIKAAAARIWEKIKSFLAGLFKSTEGLIKLINGLRERARQVPSGAKLKEKTIEHAGIARGISVNGKADFDSFKKVYDNTEALAVAVKNFAKADNGLIKSAKDLVSKEVNETNVKAYLDSNKSAVTQSVGIFTTALASAKDALKDMALDEKAIKKYKPKKPGDKDTFVAFGPFVGSTVLTIETTERKEGDSTHVTFGVNFVGVKTKVAEKVGALEVGQIQEVLSLSLKLASTLNDYKKVESDVATVTKATQGLADTVIKAAQSTLSKTGSSTATRLGLQAVKDSVTTSLNTINATAARGPQLQFQLAKVGADYASLALRNIGDKAFGK